MAISALFSASSDTKLRRGSNVKSFFLFFFLYMSVPDVKLSSSFWKRVAPVLVYIFLVI